MSPKDPSFAVGDNLDWDSHLLDVHLVVELPFRLMFPTSIVELQYEGVDFPLLVSEDDYEVFAGAVTDNRRSCGYQGHDPGVFESRADIQALGLPLERRKQRTTVYFKTKCHEDMQNAVLELERYGLAISYFASLCEAHIPILNELVARYRLLTYDYFAFEVSAWDVPVWHVRSGLRGHISVPLFDYVSMEARPLLLKLPSKTGDQTEPPEPPKRLQLTSKEDLEAMSSASATAGENELLDARNLMERGDYSGAVRRTTTALEVLVEHQLRVELLKSLDPATVDDRLEKSKTDFPGRLRQWQKLSGVTLSDPTLKSIDEIREMRHRIVHSGRRLSHADRGLAQRLTDQGRWSYNKIEDDPVRRDLREKNNVVRSIPRPTLSLRFPVMKTDFGYQVKSFRA